MTTTFNDAAITDVFNRIVSHALTLARFDAVNQHEPKSPPGTGITASVWVQSIKPVRTSGLAAVSGALILNLRIYTSMLAEPYDLIDPQVTAATADLMATLSGDFDLGGTVREIDLLGAEGTPLSAQAGYVEISKKMYRVMTLTIPVVVNDMWTEASGA